MIPKPKRFVYLVQVTFTKDNSMMYLSNLSQFNQPHGLGMLIKQNGSTLIGKFEIGLLQNHSVFIYSNGSYYKGNMLNSMATDPNGQFHSVEMTYVGGFQNNSFHGDC